MLTSTRRDLLLLTVLSAAVFVPWLGARDLWNPNEPLYGQAVAEMAQRGDWLIPTVNGEVFDEKPILYFWLARAAAQALGGVDEWTLRLPTAAAGIAVVLLTYVLAAAYVSRRRAFIAGTIATTTFVVFWSARQVQMDLLLTACVLASVLGATRAIDGLWRERTGWLVAGAAAGAGVLAKGPVGLICPVLVVVAYALAGGRVRALARPVWWPGALACVAVAAPWYLLLWGRGETALLYELLVRQNLLRFVHPWDHAAPWWYYLEYFWIDMAPWAWFLPLAWGLTPRDDGERSLTRLCRVWIPGIVLFFSLSASKRSPYILPVAPALAILVSGLVERWIDGRLDTRRRRVATGLAVLLALGFAAGAVALATRGAGRGATDPDFVRALHTMTALVGLAGLLGLAGVVVSRARPVWAPATLGAALALVYVGASATVLPAADVFKSHRGFCAAIREHVRPDQPLRGFHEWRWRASYSYYTGRPVPNLASLADLARYWHRDERVFVVVERGRLDEAREVLGPIAPLESAAVGSNVVYLFSNRED